MARTSDVPRDHWAYTAVSELAEKGLVLGYPDGKFLGNKTLTRYEMATIVKRVIDRIEAMPKAETLPAAPTPAPATAPASVETTPAAPSVTPEELAEVKKLVEEFKTELTVIGTDLTSVKDRLDKVESTVDSVKDLVTEPEGAVQTTISDVKKLKQVRISGYAQLRYVDDQSSTVAANKNTFNLRRARVKVSARPSDKSAVIYELDMAGTGVSTKQAQLEYYLKNDPGVGPTITFGQMKWPFGYQNVQSSSVRETPEEADVINNLLPGEYDRGVKVSTATENRYLIEAGLFNGVKAGNVSPANSTDDNGRKDVAGRLRYKLLNNLDLGVSGYFGRTPTATPNTGAEFTRDLYGADAQYYLQDTSLKAEYVTGHAMGFKKSGYWAQIAHNFTKKDIGVVMYDVFDDASNIKNGNLNNWNIGYIRWMDEATRFKLFYQIRNEAKASFSNNTVTAEVITLF